MRLINIFLLMLVGLAAPLAAEMAGVCAGMCDCHAWGTCGMGSGGGGGGSIFRRLTPEEEEAQRERARLWQKYRDLKSERKQAAKIFGGGMEKNYKYTDDFFKGRRLESESIFMQKGEAVRARSPGMLGIAANPSSTQAQLLGIELARPMGEQTQVSVVSYDGLMRYAAVLGLIEDRYQNAAASTPGAYEDLYFLSAEGSAHMSGHVSRVAVARKPTERRSEGESTLESFRAAWGMIGHERAAVARSEDQRLEWAKQAAREEARVRELDAEIQKAPENKRLKLKTERASLLEKLRGLKRKSEDARVEEKTSTDKISKEAGRTTSCLEGFNCSAQ